MKSLIKKKTDNNAVKKQKEITPKVATMDFISASKEFEKSRIGDIEKSKNTAWYVAIGASGIAIVLTIAIIVMMPLKTVVPYMVRVDNNTGATDIVTILDQKTASYSEAVAKYFAALYVRQMEGYDWYTISNQVDQLLMFSDSAMQNRISNKFNMPSAPHKIYKDSNRIEVDINNISVIDEKGLLQIRFTTRLVPMNGGSYNAQSMQMTPQIETKKYIATLGYEYVNVPQDDKVRLLNPLGFTVKSYRVDQDGI